MRVSAPSRRSVSRACRCSDSCSAAIVAMCWATARPAAATPGRSTASRKPAGEPGAGHREHVPARHRRGRLERGREEPHELRRRGRHLGQQAPAGGGGEVEAVAGEPFEPGEELRDAEVLGGERAQRPEHVQLRREPPVHVALDGGRDLLRDRDERHRQRDVQHRQAALVGGLEEGPVQRRHVQLVGQGQGRDARVVEAFEVGPLAGGRPGHRHARRHDHLGAGQPGRRVLELADVRPRHGPLGAARAGQYAELKCRGTQQVLDHEGGQPLLHALILACGRTQERGPRFVRRALVALDDPSHSGPTARATSTTHPREERPWPRWARPNRRCAAGPARIETRSIDYVPENERHGRVWMQGPFWFLGNFQPFTVAIGFVGPTGRPLAGLDDRGGRARHPLRHAVHGGPRVPGPEARAAADDPVPRAVRLPRRDPAADRDRLHLPRVQRRRHDHHQGGAGRDLRLERHPRSPSSSPCSRPCSRSTATTGCTGCSRCCSGSRSRSGSCSPSA